MINNEYVGMSVQKSGLPRVKGSIEHFEAMLEVFQDSRLKIRDLGLVWLDFVNQHGAVPHLFILKVLRFYNIPDNFIKFFFFFFFCWSPVSAPSEKAAHSLGPQRQTPTSLTQGLPKYIP